MANTNGWKLVTWLRGLSVSAAAAGVAGDEEEAEREEDTGEARRTADVGGEGEETAREGEEEEDNGVEAVKDP